MSNGMRMIREAADAASRTAMGHWLEHWLKTHCYRIKTCHTDWGRRMADAALWADIETVMKDVPQNEHP